MGRKTNYVLWIKPKLISVLRVGEKTGGNLGEYEWAEETLSETLKTVTQKYGNKYCLLFDDSFIYHVGVKAVEGEDITRDSVEKLISGEVPENLAETVWGYSQINKTLFVNAVVFSGEFIGSFRKSLEEVGIEVDLVETVPNLVISGMVGEGMAIFGDGEKVLVILARGGGVVMVKTFTGEVVKEDFLKIIDYGKNYFGLEVASIRTVGKVGIDLSEMESEKLKVEVRENEMLLQLNLSSGISVVLQNEEKRKVNKKWLIGLALITTVIILGLAGYFYRARLVSENRLASAPQPVEVSVLTPSPSVAVEIKVDKSEFKIEIQNGSGVAGEAGSLKLGLEAKGWVIEKVGNATEDNYLETEIRAKLSVSEEYLQSLDKDLAEIYTVVRGVPLEDTHDGDVLIIIGKNKKQ